MSLIQANCNYTTVLWILLTACYLHSQFCCGDNMSVNGSGDGQIPEEIVATLNKTVSFLLNKVEHLESRLEEAELLMQDYYELAIDSVISSNGPRFFTMSTTIDIFKPQHVTTIPLNGRQGLSIVDGKGRVLVFEFPADSFRNFQIIAGPRAAATVGFAIEGTSYLAVAARHAANIYTFDGEIFIYRQSLPVPNSKSVAFVSSTSLNRHHLLAFASFSDDAGYNSPSHLYRWNNTTRLFTLHQTIPSTGANTVRFFFSLNKLWVAIACELNGTRREHRNAQSLVYVWNTTAFVPFQLLDTSSAQDLYPIVTSCHTFLFAANSPHNAQAHSTLYHLLNGTFTPLSSIPTNSARSVEYFQINAEHFIAIANSNSNTSNSPNSTIYRINAGSLELLQTLPFSSSVHVHFPDPQHTHRPVLLLANSVGSVQVFKWKGESLETCN